ncbi:putative permease [Escherichia coli]|uniref:Putative permease n=1 Tax=Escherichia coli TaxID=562 RepID=A0A376Y2N8_ECOLX|nr:putative permease [Escherichia coli]
MNVFSRYLIRHLFLGFAAAAGLLLPLFTTFNLINELDDVSPGGLSLDSGGAGGADDLTAYTGRTFAVYRIIGRDCWPGAVIEKQ